MDDPIGQILSSMPIWVHVLLPRVFLLMRNGIDKRQWQEVADGASTEAPIYTLGTKGNQHVGIIR